MPSFDRRDFLKYFVAGSIIAPVVDGVPKEDARALIIRPPDVELTKPARLIEASSFIPGDYECVMYLRNRLTRKVQRIETTIHATDVRRGLVFRTLPDVYLREG